MSTDASSVHSSNIVSSESEELILVDADDRELGYMSKGRCHDGDGVLHRAFSVFIFNRRGELLLQQRGAEKRLWPLYWSNSCCSHPRRGESMETATRRRLRQELDIHSDLEFVYKFSYQARFGEIGAECELCSVYLGHAREEVTANRREIAALRFVRPEHLDRELDDDAGDYTPWFRMEWRRLRDEFGDRLDAYCRAA